MKNQILFIFGILLSLSVIISSGQQKKNNLTEKTNRVINDLTGDAMSTQIKFHSSESQPFIRLPVFINNKGPFEFVLDTGAGMSIIAEELANIIVVRGTEAKEGLGAGSKKIKVLVGNVDSISIGEITVNDIQVGIMKELPKCIADGVIGYNFLKELILTIDYKSNLLTFTSPLDKKSNEHSSEEYIPFKLARPDRPIILLNVLIDDQKNYQFILDTGASQTVISSKLAKQMNIINTKTDSIIGAGGTTQSSVGTLKSLSVGEASLRNITVIIADIFSALNQAVGTKFDGILGFNFLSKFKVEIDYPNESLRFEKQVYAR